MIRVTDDKSVSPQLRAVSNHLWSYVGAVRTAAHPRRVSSVYDLMATPLAPQGL